MTRRHGIIIGAVVALFALVAYSYVATGQWSHEPRWLQAADITDGYIPQRSGSGWASVDPASLGGGNSWQVEWPASAYDWQTLGPGTEPVSGFTMVEGAPGDAALFTTLRFDSSGLVFDINNASGADVTVKFRRRLAEGVPAWAFREWQFRHHLTALSGPDGTQMIIDVGADPTGSNENRYNSSVYLTAGSRRCLINMRCNGQWAGSTNNNFDAHWDLDIIQRGSRLGETYETGYWEGATYWGWPDKSNYPPVVDFGSTDYELWAEVAITAKAGGGIIAGTVSEVAVAW